MALFVRSGDQFSPTPLTTGPWRADAQHGGPPAALLTRSIEHLLEPGETLARISVELVAPVPLEPLTVDASRSQVSRRVAHVHASIHVGDKTVATAKALALRGAELPAPGWRPDEPVPVIPSAASIERPPPFASVAPVMYHRDAVEHRMTHGSVSRVGDATSWVRLNEPLIEGEATSAVCRVLAAADFGSGISFIYEPGSEVGLVNADLTVAFTRAPIGEWTRLTSQSRVNAAGTGLAVTQLADQTGYLGVATQSLLGIHIG